MYKPSVIILDYETALTSGVPSVDYYRGDFRAVSAAFAWRRQDGSIGHLYLEGEDAIADQLAQIKAQSIPIVVHNFQFEYGVTAYRFPGFEGCIAYDTMRLVQVADNGGRQAAFGWQATDEGGLGETKPITSGLGLVASASRWLPEERKEHKATYYAWLREYAGVKRGQEGANLNLLPREMFEAYNIEDAVVTLLLYETLTAEFQVQGYDWTLDHNLYKSTARHVALAKGVGARVDVKGLAEYAKQVEAEIEAIEQAFRERFKAQIEPMEAAAHTAYCSEAKQEKTREKRRQGLPRRFNIGSNLQLKALFVDVLGVKPKFWTKAPFSNKPRVKEFVPQPSFKAAHLGTYGEGGELLVQRRKRLLVLQQTQALLKLAKFDDRWHPDIRACGTATGRMAGGGE
jgi:hypothetical protein